MQARICEEKKWWDKTTARLLSFLKGGDRDWKELGAFAKWMKWDQGFLKQAVAWLEFSNQARYNLSTKKWTRNPFATDPVIEEEREKRTCHCGTVFVVSHPSAVYCSDECKRAVQRERVLTAKRRKSVQRYIICIQCRKRVKTESRKRKFCPRCERLSKRRMCFEGAFFKKKRKAS